MIRRLFLGCAALLTATLAAAPAPAQTYPTKPIRIVVPLAPGGVTDTMARLLGQRFQDAWGQPGVVENKPGAAGALAAEQVARAPADGYMLMLGHIGTHGVNPSLYPNLSYDPVKDFAPVSLLVTVPNLLLVHPSVAATTVQELVQLGKARPGTLNGGSPGNGTSGHMSLAVFSAATGLAITHVPYRGAAPALQAVLSGEVQVLFDTLASSLPQVRDGKLRALGITVPQRSPLAPEIPTLAESGLPGFNVSPWFALFAPAGTPPALIERLNAEARKALTEGEPAARLQAQGLNVVASTPAQLAAHVDAEIARWAKIVKDAGIKAD